MTEYNNARKSIPVPPQDSSPSSGAESAKIEFLIPKLGDKRVSLKVATENVEVQAESPPLETHSSVATVSGTVLTAEETIMPLTLEEIKAKLDESVQKNYRRVFIPGRGWVSLKKLQEEAGAMESPATA